MLILDKILGDPNKKYLKRTQPLVDKINFLEPEFESHSDEKLRETTFELKERLQKGETLDNLLPEAFTLGREAAKRTLGQRHFDVQLIGGISLHQGKIVEMVTGEGKTLAATLPLYLNALEGKGCHLVTVNDYLAKRDAVWMGQIYHALGLSTGCIVHDNAYLYDPTYQAGNSKSQITNSKFTPTPNFGVGARIPNPPIRKPSASNGAGKFQIPNNERDEERDIIGGFKIVESYLRPVSRKEAYGADITYGTNNEFGFDYLRDNMVYPSARPDESSGGKSQGDNRSFDGGTYDLENIVQRGHNFAIIDEVDSILIDEARTPLIISQPDVESSKMYADFAKITPRLKKDVDYNVDEKMKAVTLTEEGISKIEKILAVDNIYAEKGMKYLHYLEQALRAEILFQKDRDYIIREGQIVIVDEFTGRLMPGRRWSGGLHQAVEAKEGVRVQPESLTLASITFQNYFRQYKKLAGMTGTALTSAEEFDKVYNLEVICVPTNKPLIRKKLPDKIFKDEKAKLGAIVQEIKKRYQLGQPVLVGTTSIEKNEYLGRLLEREGILHNILNAKNHEREGEIIAQAGKLGAVTVATNMAGRGVDIVLGGNPPDVKEAEKIKELEGLFVIGTERHEARRIDNQLRGRAGRQGDPGASQFFVSLEDDLLRIFGGERIKNLMEKFHFPENEPIEVGLVSRALEEAQSKIEGMNLDIRKHLLDYDEVLNKHRGVIYKKRREILKMSREGLRNYVSELFKKQGFPQKDYETKEKEVGESNMRQIEKTFLLRTLDFLWIDHLTMMDHLRDSVRLRSYGQQDPLVEYKREGHQMFQQLLSLFEVNTVQAILKVSLRPAFASASAPLPYARPYFDTPRFDPRLSAVKPAASFQKNREQAGSATSPRLKKKKIGRNDPCPCGSGKKYKKCCLPKYG